MAEPTKPSNLSWTNLALVLLSLVLSAFANVREDSTPAPKPESWYVTIGGEVIEAPEIIAVAEKLKPGDYELTGYPTAGKITRLRVVIGDGPQPGPEPQPPPKPDPPGPSPTPEPVDSYQQAIQSAYAAETATNKAALLAGLIAGYTQAERVAQTTEGNVGTLYSECRKAVLAQAGFVGLSRVREVIANELNGILPTDGSVTVSPEIRAKVVAEFARTRKALEAIR